MSTELISWLLQLQNAEKKHCVLVNISYFSKMFQLQISTSSSSGTRPKMQPQPSLVTPRNEVNKKQLEAVPDKICQYCKLEFTQKQLDEHEDYCGKYLHKETIQTTLKENNDH